MENKTPPLRIFVVEDSSIVRERLVAVLHELAGVYVVGEAENANAAVAGILRTQPHLVLLDVHLVDGTGMDVLRAIHPRLPDIVFVVLTNYSELIYRHAYLKAGAAFYLDKSHEFQNVPRIVMDLQQQNALSKSQGDPQ